MHNQFIRDGRPLPMIIGLCGYVGSGKGALADYLRSKGWSYYSTTDVIKEELALHGLAVTRANLIDMANSLRAEHGGGVLVERILKRIPHGANAIVESIRNPDEARALRARDDFVLVAVEAPAEERLRRIIARGRAGDPASVAELKALDARESFDTNKSGIQIKELVEMADKVVINDGTLERLHERVEIMLATLP